MSRSRLSHAASAIRGKRTSIWRARSCRRESSDHQRRMQQRRLVISNNLGMHARAAARLVRLASGFHSEIQLARSEALHRTVNAKSIFSVLLLAATKGTMIDIIVEGPDEVEAIESLSRLIEEN